MAALVVMLDNRLLSGSKAVEDDVRRKQIGSGMRGDKRRTYRFQDDTVVDHVTGKAM
jgi:protein subunit release factor A